MDWSKFAPLYSYEFDSPDLAGSGERMQPEFIERLHKARKASKVPFIINSGYRTVKHNKKVGGKPTSSHLVGWAADIACANSRHRALIMKALILAGFERIGIGKTFLHVDMDPVKDPDVYWLY